MSWSMPRPECLVPVLVLAAALAPAPAPAQVSVPEGWTLGAYFSVTSGGPGDDMKSEMRRQDWADMSHGFLTGPIGHPWVRDNGVGWALFARYRAGRFLGAGLIHASEHIASAGGYRQNATTLGTDLFLDSGVRTSALFGAVHIPLADNPVELRVDAGAALYRPSVTRNDAGEEVDFQSDSRIGPFLGIAGAVKVGRLQVFLEAQRRFVGDMDYGPYELETIDGATTHTYEQASANFDHYAVLFGVGFAL